jgi:hypothetical protein
LLPPMVVPHPNVGTSAGQVAQPTLLDLICRTEYIIHKIYESSSVVGKVGDFSQSDGLPLQRQSLARLQDCVVLIQARHRSPSSYSTSTDAAVASW